jgi:RND family efflux transporter MFP subunit
MERTGRVAYLAVLIALALATVSCARTGGAAVTQATAQGTSQVQTVAVAPVTRVDLSNDLVLTAEFEPFQEVDVMSKVSGYIRQVKVDIGDRVNEGQILATLEIPEMQDDLTKAAAAIEEAQAELATAQNELRRTEAAHDMSHLSYSRVQDVSRREPGLVPQQEVDEVHSRDLVAEAQVSTAKSHVTACEQRLRVAQAEQARYSTLYRYAVISAPFTGVVTKRYANTGSLIQAGTSYQTQAMPVVRLSENNLLRLALPVPESAVPSVHLGESVDVRVSSMNRTFRGRVARFSEKIDQSTRTMKTEVDVPNPSLLLVPGMYAEVDLVTSEKKNVLSVPVEAIDGSGTNTRVYTVQPSGMIQIVPIRTGIETAQRTEVLAGGLKEGDNVVVGSRSGLKDGITVEPKLIRLSGNPAPKS